MQCFNIIVKYNDFARVVNKHIYRRVGLHLAGPSTYSIKGPGVGGGAW